MGHPYTPGKPMFKEGIGMVKTRIDENGDTVPLTYRHGDVMIFALVEHEFGDKAEIGDKATLALGEVTGHHHTVEAPKIKMELAPEANVDNEATQFKKIGTAGEPMYFEILECGDGLESAPLTHQEHAKIDLPKGAYRSVIQRQYTAKEIRRVYD